MTRLETELREGLHRHGLDKDRPVLVAMMGLPRSGKSTWARMMDVPIVCPDHVRMAMHGRPFLDEAEQWVWPMVKTMTKALFFSGHWVVILDATNTTVKRRSSWFNPMWMTLFKPILTPMSLCLERAEKTARPDLLPVIQKMVHEWQDLTPEEGTLLSKFTDL